MLLQDLLKDLKEVTSSELENKAKELVWLFFMTIFQHTSIHQSGVSAKYLKRIYRFFNSPKELFDIESLQLQFLEEILRQWAGYHPSYRRKHPLVFSVDDSVLEKYGRKMKFLRQLKSPQGHFVEGYSLLLITVAIGKGPGIPIFIHWHQKDDPSKIEIARKRLVEHIEKICREYSCIDPAHILVCFDNWYLCERLCQSLSGLGVLWVSKLRSNWKIAAEVSRNSYRIHQLNLFQHYLKVCGLRVREFFGNVVCPQRVFRIWHRSLGNCYATEVRTASGKAWVVCNKSIRHQTMKRFYRLRWSIEVVFRDLKQVLKIGYTHFVDFFKNQRLVELKLLIYSLLQRHRKKRPRLQRRTVGELFQQMKKEAYLLLGKSDNLLNYLQLHIINKCQNPFNSLIYKEF